MRKTLALTAAAALAVGVYLTVSLVMRDDAGADLPPGVVAQSGRAADAGLEVSVERVVYSASATEVWLHVRPDDPSLRLFGLGPAGAALDGQPVLSTLVGLDGRMVLRFRPGPASAPLALSIVSLQVSDDSGQHATRPGRWDLVLKGLDPRQRDEALSAEALEPVAVRQGVEEYLVHALRTPQATILTVVALAADEPVVEPMVLSLGRPLARTRSEQAGNTLTLWFPATPAGTDLEVDFPAKRAPARAEAEARITFPSTRLPALETTRDDGLIAVEWKPGPQASEGIVNLVPLNVSLVVIGSGVRLHVQFDGPLIYGAFPKPVALGDGVDFELPGVTVYNATADQSARTAVNVILPGRKLPSELVIRFGQQEGSDDPAVRATLIAPK